MEESATAHAHLGPDTGNCETNPTGTFIHTDGDNVALVPADATSVHHHLLPPPSPAPHYVAPPLSHHAPPPHASPHAEDSSHAEDRSMHIRHA